MSEASGNEGREHEPTEEKIRRALERGDVPVASDFWLLGSLVAVCVALGLIDAFASQQRIGGLGRLLELAGVIRLARRGDIEALLFEMGRLVAPAWAAVVLALVLVAVSIGALPQPPRVAWSRLSVDASRLNPLTGAARLFGSKSLVSFLKNVAKGSVAGAWLAAVAREHVGPIAGQTSRDMVSIGADMLDLMTRAAFVIATVIVAFAILDLIASRWIWRRKLRMSRQEMKDEARQSDGDPHVKMRMRSIALDRARKRMLTDVKSATMVITNPTHYALALRYVREEGGTPLVVAKGQELLALKIRSEAQSHDIPIIEQPELARAMYASVEIGQAIPVEFYRAVAEIVNFLAARRAFAPRA